MMKRNRMIRNIGIVIVAVVFLAVILVLLVKDFTRGTDYLMIDNFDGYYYNVPDSTKENIFLDLKKTVELNLSQGVPQSGAMIRNTEPYLYTYNAKNGWYVGSFVVDIPNIQQSYKVEFNYSEDPDYAIGGYAVLIYCLPDDKMVYPDFGCKENLPFIKEEN